MKKNFPMKLSAANLPTKIERLKLSDDFEHIEVYLKRDDQTGFELSGNKVRKLDYVMHEIKDEGIDHVITCGGIQSNHARATAAYCAKLGIKCTLVLKGVPEKPLCNHYMDTAFGANIHFISAEDYKYKRNEIMKAIGESSKTNYYVIPEGASDGLGNLGYFDAYEEIIEDALSYDMIALAVGSCGTYAGLLLGRAYYEHDVALYGINIYDAHVDYVQKTYHLVQKSKQYFSEDINIQPSDIVITNDYVGEGYGITCSEVLNFMKDFSSREGILLDKVYTGKAMFGLYQELRKKDRTLTDTFRVLFIHTGGTFVY